ncbi:MAG: [acyl-carrier-protein] S-malonyltransferase [Crocinitomicaceae bacterium]|nr:[acyl-carrier-protein] S-malonyltransferase [Crocinitomicaceae bacterium]|tara:strand:+ start:26406 stop:27293 length:888 start_codon:yes stop_codon:yes gene_type:complete
MKAYVFPGQGAQFTGMGKDLYEYSSTARDMFHMANDFLGFDITKIMFEGTLDELKQTKVTQPSIFLHSTILTECLKESFAPSMVAGHSLGEFSALVANKVLSFEDGLNLVYKRALAMQEACEAQPTTMAAIIGLDDNIVERVCDDITDVVAANYNCPGQLVISGSFPAIEEACNKLTELGARRALVLPVGGAFHSPFMEPAREKLASAIDTIDFHTPTCPIFQNFVAEAINDPIEIKQNLIAQLTAPVRWTEIMRNMITGGATEVIEVGPGKVLQGLFKKIDRNIDCSSAVVNQN